MPAAEYDSSISISVPEPPSLIGALITRSQLLMRALLVTGSATALNVGNVETAAGNAAGSDPATPPAPAENHTQESSRHFPAAAVPAAPPVVTSTAATASATAGETAPACPHSMTVVAEEGAPPDSVTSSTHAASQSAPSTAGLSTAPTQISPPPPPPPLSAAAGSSGSESSSSACTAPSPTSPPPYLAAGVLPFCILGGDLLFLLGQELRFRSRVRGGTCAAMRGFSTPGVGGAVGESEDRGASGAPRKLPPSLVSRQSMRAVWEQRGSCFAWWLG